MQRINTRNLAVVGGLLVLGDALIAGMWLQARQHDAQSIPAYRVTHPVTSGTLLTAQDVMEVRVPEPGDGLAYQSTSPVGETVKVSLVPSDILRADDLAQRDESLSRVAVTLTMAPPMSPGDRIDIYAGSQGCQVGWNVPVLVQGAAGEPTTVLVAKELEAQLVAITARKIPLIATVSAVPPLQGVGHPAVSGSTCLASSAVTGPNGDTP